MSDAKRRWRLFVTPAASGPENMALDEALMSAARAADEWIVRVYSWKTPTISLGRNQSARGRYDLDQIRALGLAVVRRPTGGRAILHDREITYSVTAPTDGAGELLTSYARVNALLVAALGLLGVDAEVAEGAERSRGVSPGMAPCFAEPSAGELTIGGRKLAGSAQWRTDGSLLQHGSILVEDDQSVLVTLSLEPAANIPAPATLSGALGRTPTASDVAGALGRAIQIEEGAAPVPFVVDDVLRARTEALIVRYLDDAWTWRR
ncbi:MAG TPA: hypothetical protein VHV78_14725 [Gemmatimonadaceae bacterium]|jgi:lipoate-protein ligase A|nr:hypothetical protein [Gemmatimonadaceae bacterium]